MTQKIAVIIGAGPAGLTAAYELLERTNIKPIIFEAASYAGGLSKTVNYNGNRLDLGGHRFFSKSRRVRDWWITLFPLTSGLDDLPDTLEENVMLLRSRHSRIFYLRKLFDYPLSLTGKTIQNLGLSRLLKIILSYLKTRLFPKNTEQNLEDFFINRFGQELYLTFFKGYTEKIWGVPCREINPEWGAQRIKGLSVTKALLHSLAKLFHLSRSNKTETSLIESFWYPKYGPGQLWEKVAALIIEKGGEIHYNSPVIGMLSSDNLVTGVDIINANTNLTRTIKADYLFSTMPIKDLVQAISKHDRIPNDIAHIGLNLQYRDFITVGILLSKLQLKPEEDNSSLIKDNWLYIQENDVRVGRIQIYNNWSPFLVRDLSTVWLGLEYFCNEGDNFWQQDDQTISQIAMSELEQLGIAKAAEYLDSTVIRVPKAYPAYWGTYEQFDKLKEYFNRFKNLFLIGRNGMHKYNNADHSMLTAMVAVDNIITGVDDKNAIWDVNTEQEYHETISQHKNDSIAS